MNNLVIPSIIVIGSGAFGGLINSLLSDRDGIWLGAKDPATGIYKLGILGNIFLGIAAAFLTWALYGSANAIIVWSSAGVAQTDVSLSLSAIAGAIMAGIGGAKVITSEVDKKFLKDTAATLAVKAHKNDLAAQMITIAPSQASQMARLP
jgi:hypothetical protein